MKLRFVEWSIAVIAWNKETYFMCVQNIFVRESPSIGLMNRVFPMIRETGVQSQVESYQRLKKWYLMPPYIIRYRSRVKWSNPENWVEPFPIPHCSSYWKWNLQVTLRSPIYIYIYIEREREREMYLCLNIYTTAADISMENLILEY